METCTIGKNITGAIYKNYFHEILSASTEHILTIRHHANILVPILRKTKATLLFMVKIIILRNMKIFFHFANIMEKNVCF